MVARLVISPVVPLITDGFGISKSAIGFALSAMWAAYALSQFPSGLLGDRFGERTVILAAVGFTGVASIFLAVSPSFAVFFVFVVLLGTAAGLHYSVATTLLTKQFESIGRAIGLHVAGGPLAGLLAPIAAAYVGSRFGWRYAIALGAVAAVPVFTAFAWQVRPTPPERPDQAVTDRVEFGPVIELLSRPSISYTTALAVIGAFAWQSTASFLPAFLEGHHGLRTTTAAALFSVYFVVHGATQPLTGLLSDRYSRDVAAALTMFVGLIGYGLLITAPNFAMVVVAIPLVGLAMSWGAPIQSRFMDNLSEAERGAGFGLVRTVYMIIGASGSVIVGVLADYANWMVAFGILSLIMGLGFVLITGNRLLELGY